MDLPARRAWFLLCSPPAAAPEGRASAHAGARRRRRAMPAIVETIASLPLARRGAAKLRRSPEPAGSTRRVRAQPPVQVRFSLVERAPNRDGYAWVVDVDEEGSTVRRETRSRQLRLIEAVPSELVSDPLPANSHDPIDPRTIFDEPQVAPRSNGEVIGPLHFGFVAGLEEQLDGLGFGCVAKDLPQFLRSSVRVGKPEHPVVEEGPLEFAKRQRTPGGGRLGSLVGVDVHPAHRDRHADLTRSSADQIGLQSQRLEASPLLQRARARRPLFWEKAVDVASWWSVLREVDDPRERINADRFVTKVTHRADRCPREVALTFLRQNLEDEAVVVLPDFFASEPSAPRSRSTATVPPGTRQQREFADGFAVGRDHQRAHPPCVLRIVGVGALDGEGVFRQLLVIPNEERVALVRQGNHPVMLGGDHPGASAGSQDGFARATDDL